MQESPIGETLGHELHSGKKKKEEEEMKEKLGHNPFSDGVIVPTCTAAIY